MNQELLFKGKSKDTGQWVFGYPYITNGGEHEIGAYNPEVNIERCTHVVEPGSYGQYTGKTADRSCFGEGENELKVFCGDIVRIIGYDGNNNPINTVETVRWNTEYAGFAPFCWDYYEIEELEVVGNAFNTPAIKGAADEAKA